MYTNIASNSPVFIPRPIFYITGLKALRPKCQSRNEVCGIRDQRSGIKDHKGEIWDHNFGISNHRPCDCNQQFFTGIRIDQAVQFLCKQGPKTDMPLESSVRNLGTKIGSGMKKHTLLRPCNVPKPSESFFVRSVPSENEV